MAEKESIVAPTGKSNEKDSFPIRIYARKVSNGERVKLQPDKPMGGCWMIRTEFVQKLVDGKLNEIYFTWVPDRPGWRDGQ